MAARKKAMRNPSMALTWKQTGTNAPNTHMTWNRVSNLAKARPRLASGASRWRIESNATLPAVPA